MYLLNRYTGKGNAKEWKKHSCREMDTGEEIEFETYNVSTPIMINLYFNSDYVSKY